MFELGGLVSCIYDINDPSLHKRDQTGEAMRYTYMDPEA